MDEEADWLARFIVKVNSYGQLEEGCTDERLINLVKKLSHRVVGVKDDDIESLITPFDDILQKDVSAESLQKIIDYRVTRSLLHLKSRTGEGDYLYDFHEFMCYPIEILAPLKLFGNESVCQEVDWYGFERFCEKPDSLPPFKEPEWIGVFRKMASF